MKRHIAFWVSAMMTVNLFTAVPAFATDDFSDVEVVRKTAMKMLKKWKFRIQQRKILRMKMQ